MSRSIDLSVCVTAHSEGIIIHKTLLSIQEALVQLKAKQVSYEVILHCDNPTLDTSLYVEESPLIKELGVRVIRSSFGDPSDSRNKCVKDAMGEFITFIDADDLMSSNWLVSAFTFLKSKKDRSGDCLFVAHSELTVEFEDAKTVVRKHGEINKSTDSILSVYANRWNVVLMIQKKFLLKYPYEKNGKGYGYEDWNLNCKTIAFDMHNVLIPETVIFVRRKTNGSLWAQHQGENTVLKANPLLAFDNFKSLNQDVEVNIDNQSSPSTLARASRLTKRVYARYGNRFLRSQESMNKQPFPEWLTVECIKLHSFEKNIFPDKENYSFYDSITPEHTLTGQLYLKMVRACRYDSYDYLFFIPWLVKGGADKFFIDYVNTIVNEFPNLKIGVITTLNQEPKWANKLRDGIDLIQFGAYSEALPGSVKEKALEQFVENSGCSVIHIINSAMGYDFILKHKSYIKSSNKKIIVTSFSQSTDSTGRIFGYSHTHVPGVYDLATLITSDNQAVCTMWVSEYGFAPEKLRVHRQKIELVNNDDTKIMNDGQPMKVLWAARLSPEKMPQLVSEIGNLVKDYPIEIHMFGGIDHGFDDGFIQSLPGNVIYEGSFDGFDSLNPNNFDVFLYTSLFDGMPNVLLEAGSYGMPIISSDVGGISELLLPENGILISQIRDSREYAEALIDLYKSPNTKEQYRKNIMNKISLDFSEKQYKNSIREMIQLVGLNE